MKIIKTTTAEETIKLGNTIGEHLIGGAVIAITGPLGAGKTTLVKGIAHVLGIAEEITSPSFTIISEYFGKYPFYHIDLYRLNSPSEIQFLGLEEILYGTGISVIEWSEKIEDLLPENCIRISISINRTANREFVIEGINS